MPNKYEGSGELAAIIAERDALQRQLSAVQESFAMIEAKLQFKLAEAREALRGMLSRWGLCHEVTAGGPWQVITDPMADHRCGKCESCRARQVLKEIGDAK